jgi:hypothetical protein
MENMYLKYLLPPVFLVAYNGLIGYLFYSGSGSASIGWGTALISIVLCNIAIEVHEIKQLSEYNKTRLLDVLPPSKGE